MNRLLKTLEGQFEVVVLDMDRPNERQEAQRRFNQVTFPSYAVLDGKGTIVTRKFGEQPEAGLRQLMLDAAAAGKQ